MHVCRLSTTPLGRSPLAGAVDQRPAAAQLRDAEDARHVGQGDARLVLKVRVRRGQVFQRAVDVTWVAPVASVPESTAMRFFSMVTARFTANGAGP